MPEDPLKREFYLPYVPRALIGRSQARVRLLDTDERWYGMTYREDVPMVRDAVARMRAQGLYPEDLWK